jgi:hypothetical protein
MTSVSASELAEVLWADTLNRPHALIFQALGDRVGTVQIEKELLLFRASVVNFYLMGTRSFPAFRSEQTTATFFRYMRHLKAYVLRQGWGDDRFLAELEERSGAYANSIELWSSGHEGERKGGRRPPETVMPVQETFARFCGIGPLGIADSVAIDEEWWGFQAAIARLMGQVRIKCSAEEIREVRSLYEKNRPDGSEGPIR